MVWAGLEGWEGSQTSANCRWVGSRGRQPGGATGWPACHFSADHHSLPVLQIILKLAAANGVAKVVVGKDAIMATPAMSAMIRRCGMGLQAGSSGAPAGVRSRLRPLAWPSAASPTQHPARPLCRRELYGGLIMSASHNPGGPEEDWGIKFNYSSGGPGAQQRRRARLC